MAGGPQRSRPFPIVAGARVIRSVACKVGGLYQIFQVLCSKMEDKLEAGIRHLSEYHLRTPTRKMTNHADASTETAGSYKMNPLTSSGPSQKGGLRLRSACDHCHAAKVKCSGGPRCTRCRDQNLPCVFNFASRAGKPKGSKNKKTIEKHAQIREQHAARLSFDSCAERSADSASLPAALEIASSWTNNSAGPTEVNTDINFWQLDDVSKPSKVRTEMIPYFHWTKTDHM